MVEDTAAHREGCSASCSATIRTARARTSGENLFVVLVVIDPTSHELGSPAKPVRFNFTGVDLPETSEPGTTPSDNDDEGRYGKFR